ncbi:MAG: ABC transporter substrate-binding protein, partial [Oscillospiraceae bacterium]|nr:ABC transporter substrate-binding protein [Oscillospiraceae bacterium]
MKKIAVLILCAVVLLQLIGCSNSEESKTDSSPQSPAANVPVQDIERETVTDASGTELEIPETDDIKIASAYAVAVPFIVALGLSDNVVAINYKSKFWADNADGLAKAGSVGRGIVDLEALASYLPDVLIHRTNDPKTSQAAEELGVTVMSIRAEDIDEIMSTLDLIGRFCGVQERAEEVKNWMNDGFDRVAKIVDGIPEDERPTAVVMGGELGVVAGGDMLQSWMLEHSGAVSLTAEIEGGMLDGNLVSAWANIGMERLFAMNPDVIFCTSSTVLDYSAKEILEDPAFSGINAVLRGRVFQIPAKLDAWDLPGVNCVIGTMWMLHMLYPELLTADELQAEIDGY